MGDSQHNKARIGNLKVASRLTAAGQALLLNDSRRRNLPFVILRGDRSLYLQKRPLGRNGPHDMSSDSFPPRRPALRDPKRAPESKLETSHSTYYDPVQGLCESDDVASTKAIVQLSVASPKLAQESGASKSGAAGFTLLLHLRKQQVHALKSLIQHCFWKEGVIKISASFANNITLRCR